MSIWNALIGFLTSLSADPQAAQLEHPRAAAAVAVAYASLAPEHAPKDKPPAKPCITGTCKPSGSVLR